MKIVKVKDGEAFVVHGWMRNQLGLKGSELAIYALIYGYTQTEDHEYAGGYAYLSEFTGICKNSVITSLRSLIEKGYIIKTVGGAKGIEANHYVAVRG